MEILVVIVLLVVLDVAAMLWGYDSRDAARLGAPYPRHAGLLAPPEPPVRRAARATSAPAVDPIRPAPVRAHPLRPVQPAPLQPMVGSERTAV
jgi:hypothetical protein